MSRTVSLLSESAMRTFLADDDGTEVVEGDLYRAVGLDAVMSEDEAARYVGPFKATVLCSEGLHEIAPGTDCWDCLHTTGNDPACPGRG